MRSRKSRGKGKDTSSVAVVTVQVIEFFGEGVENFLDQDFRRRRARGHTQRPDAVQRRPVDVGGAQHQLRVAAAVALGHLLQALGIGGIGRADDDEGVDLVRDFLHRFLAVGGRVADVLLVRADDLRISGRRASTTTAMSSTDSVVWVT